MKKILILAAVAALSAGLVFVACTKESTNIDKVANEQVVKHQQMHKLMVPDTIYIGGEYGDRNSYCEDPGYGCLQGVTVRAVGRTLENIQDVFNALVTAESGQNAESTKRNILLQEYDLFSEIIQSDWLDAIIASNGSISCRAISSVRYILEVSLITDLGSRIIFQYGDDSISEFAYVPVVLSE